MAKRIVCLGGPALAAIERAVDVAARSSSVFAFCPRAVSIANFDATHKTPQIKNWLARRPRYHVHFSPPSASWINQVERWFAELTRQKLQRGVHTSIKDLEADIKAFIDKHNENPKPYKWQCYTGGP